MAPKNRKADEIMPVSLEVFYDTVLQENTADTIAAEGKPAWLVRTWSRDNSVVMPRWQS